MSVFFRSLPNSHFPAILPVLLLVATSGIVITGCHRGYYRRQADREAQRLIQEKSCDARWNQSSDGTVEVDPYSRMFDPFSFDHPPIPPDDPASHQLMQCVNGRRGYPHWHANGDTNHVANPEWRSYLPINEKGQVVLDLESAYQMALLHSTDLQAQREILYLSALEVSLERFGFDSQLFAGFNTFLTNQGANRGGGTILSNTFGANSEGLGFSKLGITGTTFAVGLANSILWNFSGANTQAATSLIDFSLIQPLLRGAGRDRILEALTQAERDLLADVRQLDRFRRGFYLNIVTGRNPGAGPGGNFLGTPVGASGGVGGYIGLLEQQQQIRIAEFNVRQTEDLLEQFRELFRRERIDSLQVRQFEGNLYDAQNALLSQKINYQTALDNFKRDLGLPPDLEIVINDQLLDRFEFISDELTSRQDSIIELRTTTGESLNIIDEFCPTTVDEVRAAEFRWPKDIGDRIADLIPFMDQAEEIIAQMEAVDLKQIEKDLETLKQVRPDRVEYLEKLKAAINRGEILADVEPSIVNPELILDAKRLQEQLQIVKTNLDIAKQNISEIRDRIERFDESIADLNNEQIYTLIREKIGTDTSERLTDLYKVTLEMSLVQARARANSIGLPEVDLQEELAFKIAKCFRRDLMNARAALVDQWRQIEFFADDLESEFDLILEGDLGNNGNSPFSFRSANGSIRGGFRIDTPIVRLNERNNYRAALINYQQARRGYYEFEDAISANLRRILREIDLNKILFELNRINVQVAIEQLELAQLNLADPSATSLGATTARDLTGAISNLQRTQTAFLNVWVDFEVLRLNLDFDLGTFQMSPDQSWIDPEVIDETIARRAAALMGIDLDDECYCQIFDSTMQTESMVPDDESAPQESDSDPTTTDLAPMSSPNSGGPEIETLKLPPQPEFETDEVIETLSDQ